MGLELGIGLVHRYNNQKTGLETDIRIRITVCLYSLCTSTAYQVQTLDFVDSPSPSGSYRIWALHRRHSKSEFDRKVG